MRQAEIGRASKLLSTCVRFAPDSPECSGELSFVRHLSKQFDHAQLQLSKGRRQLNEFYSTLALDKHKGRRTNTQPSSVSLCEMCLVHCRLSLIHFFALYQLPYQISVSMSNAAHVYRTILSNYSKSLEHTDWKTRHFFLHPVALPRHAWQRSGIARWRPLPTPLLHHSNILACIVFAEIPTAYSWEGHNGTAVDHWNVSEIRSSCSFAIDFLSRRNHGTEFSTDHREALAVAHLVRARSLLSLHELQLQNQTAGNGSVQSEATSSHPSTYFEFRFGSETPTSASVPGKDRMSRVNYVAFAETCNVLSDHSQVSSKYLVAAGQDLQLARSNFPQLTSRIAASVSEDLQETRLKSGSDLFRQCSQLLAELRSKFDEAKNKGLGRGQDGTCTGEHDFYDILSVVRSRVCCDRHVLRAVCQSCMLPLQGQNASFRAVKRAYRKLALKWHPDKYSAEKGHYSEEYTAVLQREEVVAIFILVSEVRLCLDIHSVDFVENDHRTLQAYDALSEAELRAQYDKKCGFSSLWEGGADARRRADTGACALRGYDSGCWVSFTPHSSQGKVLTGPRHRQTLKVANTRGRSRITIILSSKKRRKRPPATVGSENKLLCGYSPQTQASIKQGWVQRSLGRTVGSALATAAVLVRNSAFTVGGSLEPNKASPRRCGQLHSCSKVIC